MHKNTSAICETKVSAATPQIDPHNMLCYVHLVQCDKLVMVASQNKLTTLVSGDGQAAMAKFL